MFGERRKTPGIVIVVFVPRLYIFVCHSPLKRRKRKSAVEWVGEGNFGDRFTPSIGKVTFVYRLRGADKIEHDRTNDYVNVTRRIVRRLCMENVRCSPTDDSARVVDRGCVVVATAVSGTPARTN